MADIEFETPEETEYLDRSLSVWKGKGLDTDISYYCDDFVPVPLDLHTACSIGHLTCVQLCIKRKENIDYKNKGGWTPLMYASYIGHHVVVSELLEGGASVNNKNSKGQTPLCLAASCGNCNVSQRLLQEGADVDARDLKGWTSLFHATYSGHHNMVKLLLENGANIDAVEPRHGMTPLMEASAAGHETIVQYFLQHGVNTHARSHCGETALSLAVSNGHTKVTNLIQLFMKKVKTNVAMQASNDSERRNWSEKIPFDLQKTKERSRLKDVSISEGPETFAWLLNQARHRQQTPNTDLPFQRSGAADLITSGSPNILRLKHASAPNDEEDDDEDDGGFSQTGVETIKSSSGSSAGLLKLKMEHGKNRDSNPGDLWNSGLTRTSHESLGKVMKSVAALNGSTDCGTIPNAWKNVHYDLKSLLNEIGLVKYASVFEEQDVDFDMFLTLTDNDLKEIGIKLLGPRRKMTAAIACLNSGAQNGHRQGYSDTVEQLNEANCELEKMRSLLAQETQSRTVAESCLMEDRLLWQQAASAAADISQRCDHIQEILNSINFPRDELNRRMDGDDDGGGAHSGANHTVGELTCSHPHLPTITLVDRLLLLKDELSRTTSYLKMTAEELTKRPYLVASHHSHK